MHVGPGRGAVCGDALASLLEFAGHTVTREYYINDAGAQVDVLARSAHLRYREALGEDVGAIPEGLYPGDYLVPVGQALAQKFGRDFMQHHHVQIRRLRHFFLFLRSEEKIVPDPRCKVTHLRLAGGF